MWWALYITMQIAATFIVGYIIGIIAAHARNAVGPEDERSDVRASAVSTAIVVTGIPLMVQAMLYMGWKTPKLMGTNEKLFRYE